jgi:hypothetical protein
MSDARGKTYRPWEPEHYRHEAHSPEAKLPQDDLVFFLLDTVCLSWTCAVSMPPMRRKPGGRHRLTPR